MLYFKCLIKACLLENVLVRLRQKNHFQFKKSIFFVYYYKFKFPSIVACSLTLTLAIDLNLKPSYFIQNSADQGDV